MDVSPRVHDLVRAEREAFDDATLPTWARASLDATPWVVVRRAAAPNDDLLAVGVRGAARTQRRATVLRREHVRAIRTPESLLTVAPARMLPVFAALPAIRAAADRLAIVCGPGGSVGFELATGAPAASPASDCDLVVRPAPRDRLAAFARALAEIAVRIDALVEFPEGAIALAEVVRGGTCLVRSADGPRSFALLG